MSFNIRFDNPQDGANAWPLRRDMVARTLLFHKVDIVGLQEVLQHQLTELETQLPGYTWFGVGRDDGATKGEYAPIGYRTDRFKLIKSGTFWLSETPDTTGSRGWDAALPRIVTWAHFSEIRSSRAFFFFNTHFDHMGEQARRNSALLLTSRVREYANSLPCILTGDFNSTRQDSAYLALIQPSAGWQDSEFLSESGHYGGTQSFNAFQDLLQPGYLIDFIFVKGIARVTQHGLIAERWDGRFVSDHYPVLMEALLP
jgi:endonuclease/exonuclease/phosphatase family metal-dependent hydrolase